MSSKLKTKQPILLEIAKAFREVNLICHQYFHSKNIQSSKNTTLPQYKNFNLYKFNKNDNQFSNKQQLNSTNSQPDFIDIDQEKNLDLNEYQYPQKEEKSYMKIGDKKILINPKKHQITKKITYPLQRESFQTAGKYILNEKNKKVQSIPAPPKAPLSPYFTFYRQKKDLIKQEFPQMSITELASAATKVWKSLTEEEKEPYNKKYFEQKKSYEKNMKEYAEKYPNYKQVLKSGKLLKK